MGGHVLIIGALIALSGCTTGGAQRAPANPMTDPERSLIFGYIDMSAAPRDSRWISLFQALPKTETPYRNDSWQGGLFYFVDLEAGSYQLSGFGGDGFDCKFQKYGRNKTAARIGARGVYFMGAYRYTDDSRLLLPGTFFDIEPLKSPTERELLTELAERVKGSPWEARVSARLAELSQ
jgi:hypothetical protein